MKGYSHVNKSPDTDDEEVKKPTAKEVEEKNEQMHIMTAFADHTA